MTSIYNINLLGDGGVGKTAWIRNIRGLKFVGRYNASVDYEVDQVLVRTNYGTFILNLWDYAGQEKYTGRTYYKSDASILMFDLTSMVSYKNLRDWRKKCGTEPVLVVGNKNDIAETKVEPDTPFISVSAKKMSPAELLTPILRRLTGRDDLVILE